MKLQNIILIFIILLIISGCKIGVKRTTPSQRIEEIYTGKQGLEMEFFENAPPKETLEGADLPVAIRLYNKGVYDIDGGYLSIGIENDYMFIKEESLESMKDTTVFVDDEHITFNLEGKGIEYPKGGQEFVRFTVTAEELSKDPQSESHTSLISVTSCYEYQTKATATVCIDTDIYGFKKREKVCDAKETITLSSQGAPVAVTKIESEMIPDGEKVKPRFTITIKNLGEGEVFKYDKVKEACSSEPLDYNEWNNINVKVYLSTKEGDKLDCNITGGGKDDDGTLNLREKEGKIRCSYEQGIDKKEGTFSAPLRIILDYGYTNTISKNVEIKKILTH